MNRIQGGPDLGGSEDRRMHDASAGQLKVGSHTPSLPAARPRLLAIDVDGTLLNSRHKLSEATVNALAQARTEGVEVLLASSRGPRAMFPILSSLGLTDPCSFIGSQGALTGRYAADRALLIDAQHPIPVTTAREIVVAAGQHGVQVSWFAADDWYVSGFDHTVEREARIVGCAPEVRDLLAEENGPDKLMMIAPSDDVAPLQSIAARLSVDVRAQVSNPTYLEVTRVDVDKAAAVVAYCDHRGITSAEVVAFGDGPNDLGLFAFAGTSVAPANARPEVLAAATLRTDSNDEDGIARAVTALLRL
ncbi:HAD family hydrolase [Streptomyces sp. YIM S03343]